MHFHLPKPLHGWREFAGEVGIIVIGVLIALAAEQAVEAAHWRTQAAEARNALRAELNEDDLPQAFARLAVAPCIDAQLKQLQSALDQHMDRSKFALLAHAYLPPSRTWDSEAWQAVLASGDLAHGGSGALIRWSLPYRIVKVLGPRNDAEGDDRENLRSISSEPGQLTPAEADRVTVALERLRNGESHMVSASQALIASARTAGVQMSPAQRRIALEQLRPAWGACIRDPGEVTVDPTTQNDLQFQR
jgi:hypothetical protein